MEQKAVERQRASLPARAGRVRSMAWLATVLVSVAGLGPAPLPGTSDRSAAHAATASAAGFTDDGPGGPVLVITSAANPFSRYYGEILRNEGLNAYRIADVAAVSPTMLNGYDVAILGEMTLAATQVTMLTDWVTAGGNLIAMRPDKQLASVLGLTAGQGTLSNAYLRIDSSTAPGAGIVGEPIQFHGTADLYTVAGATSVANLYSTATSPTPYAAVTTRSVGSSGGSASSFTYDLSRSVVLSRQGNPAWASQDRDGALPIRSNDLYFGAKTADVKPDWVDLTKVVIPQADEQQRLLVNLIEHVNATRKPLPRFWYMPAGHKAAIIMTGDDHGNGGTAGRFDTYLAQSSPECSNARWECIRSTSYVYPNTPLSDSAAAGYAAKGFEVALHVNTNCADWTSQAQLESFYSNQLSQWRAKYSSLSAPVTNRTHCIPWSDWLTQASVEATHGMRLDTTYYYWPPKWVGGRPGFFTGSGFPMRFASTDGTIVDVYQAATQLTDESGQPYPSTVDTLIDNALGPLGYYGIFTANMHTDVAASADSDALIASAKARGVPVISARQALEWLDGRNSSTFGSLAWSGSTLSFELTAGSGAGGLQAMVPTRAGAQTLTGITRAGTPVSHSTQTIKGIDYAFFDAASGAYQVTYGPDTTAPSVAARSPLPDATGVPTGVNVTASFTEPVQANTVSFELRDGTSAPVPATVSYDAGTRTATLDPTADLLGSTTYSATVSAAADLSGNGMTAPVSWSFTTAVPPTCPCSIWSSSAVPAIASENDGAAIEVGVRFRADRGGWVTGIRFYKGTGNNGTHVGSLWSASGTKLASATFKEETASGWQQVDFATPVAITAGTTYVASYHAPTGHYAATVGYFASTGVDNPPLHALANGVDGANGVYRYGAPAFPTDTYQSSNYWVDAVFMTTAAPPTTTTTTIATTTTTTLATTTTVPPTTTTVPATTTTTVDTTPPTVSSTSPKAGATQVSVNAKVTATFNEPVTRSSISFTLRDFAGVAVGGTVTYDATSRTATFTPSTRLLPASSYTASIHASDGAGNAMPTPKTWSFRTKL